MKKIFLCIFVAITFLTTQVVFAADVSSPVGLQNAFIEVAKRVGPAVVSISTIHTEKIGIRRYYFGGSPFNDEFFDKFFRDFFEGMPQEGEFQQRGLGSGVIIDENGLILTNEHVIKGADKITVTLADGRKFDGQIKGTDPRSDLAVIKINAKKLPFAELGNSDEVKIGQWSIAIGNPFGYIVGSSEPTVTVGVVSALNRSIRTQQEMDRDYTGLIQTDAAINTGNSGGPLVDVDGKIIAINVAIFSTSGGYQGIGFAIPINRAKNIIPDLAQGKKILYGWVGIRIQDLDERLAAFFGLPDTKGVLVVEAIKGGPASGAGIKEQDIIRTLNFEPVENTRQFVEKISHTKVGSSVSLDVLRNGKPLNFTIKIQARPEEIAKEIEKEEIQPGRLTKLWRGIEVSDVTKEIARRYDIQEGRGVLISKIDPNSPAYQAGLGVGDIIEQINRIDIRNVSDFSKVVNSLKGDALVRTARGYTIVKEEVSTP